jgi:hypothetical protein
VWNARASVAERNRPRFTPGAGIRVRTLFGTVRADLGYNPYPRPAGAAYAIATAHDPISGRTEDALYCVSPGNTLPVSGPATGQLLPSQAAGECDGFFTPPTDRGFFKRLNPSIWIGAAF